MKIVASSGSTNSSENDMRRHFLRYRAGRSCSTRRSPSSTDSTGNRLAINRRTSFSPSTMKTFAQRVRLMSLEDGDTALADRQSEVTRRYCDMRLEYRLQAARRGGGC